MRPPNNGCEELLPLSWLATNFYMYRDSDGTGEWIAGCNRGLCIRGIDSMKRFGQAVATGQQLTQAQRFLFQRLLRSTYQNTTLVLVT